MNEDELRERVQWNRGIGGTLLIEFGKSPWHANARKAFMGAPIRRRFLKDEEPFSCGTRFPQSIFTRKVQRYLVGKVRGRHGKEYAVAGIVQVREQQRPIS